MVKPTCAKSTIIHIFINTKFDRPIHSVMECRDHVLFKALSLYKNYKLNYKHETCLSCLNIKKFRHTLSKLRTGSQYLEIELDRHQGRSRNDRICKMCDDGMDDE